MKPSTLILLASLNTAPTDAAQLQGHYVTLVTTTELGTVSVIPDLLPDECSKIGKHLASLGMFKTIDCLAIDYKTENKKR